MRFSVGSFLLGMGAFWALQHFTGIGSSGKGKSGG